MNLPKRDPAKERAQQKATEEAAQPKKFEKDLRMYNSYHTDMMESKGFYNATIRFLPPSEKYPVFYAQGCRHTVKGEGKGKLLIEACPRGYDKASKIKCPVCDWMKANWTTFDEAKQGQLKRKPFYISNIYIVKDAQNPELEGKVLLYRYPRDIYNKIMNKFMPTDEAIAAGDEAVDVFDYIEGRNFKLKIKKQGNFWEFKGSEFDDSSKLCGGDVAKINAIHKGMFDLGEIANETITNFDFDKVKKRLDWVLTPAMLLEGDIQNEHEVANHAPGTGENADDIFKDRNP